MVTRFIAPALLALSLFSAGCGGSSSSGSEGPQGSAFAELTPAAGSIITAPTTAEDKEPINGFLFTNQGTTDISIWNIEVDTADGKVVTSQGGVGVEAGASISMTFDPLNLHVVDKLTFDVHGSTEKLVVTTQSQTGPVPATNAPAP